MTYEEALRALMPGIEKSRPYGHKQMLKGAAETSGMPYENVVMLDNLLKLALFAGGMSGCSSAAVWGESL